MALKEAPAVECGGCGRTRCACLDEVREDAAYIGRIAIRLMARRGASYAQRIGRLRRIAADLELHAGELEIEEAAKKQGRKA